jgi:hypothetical protein
MICPDRASRLTLWHLVHELPSKPGKSPTLSAASPLWSRILRCHIRPLCRALRALALRALALRAGRTHRRVPKPFLPASRSYLPASQSYLLASRSYLLASRSYLLASQSYLLASQSYLSEWRRAGKKLYGVTPTIIGSAQSSDISGESGTGVYTAEMVASHQLWKRGALRYMYLQTCTHGAKTCTHGAKTCTHGVIDKFGSIGFGEQQKQRIPLSY